MIENRVLMRTVVESAPDGQSVARAEYIEVELRVANDLPDDKPEPYVIRGAWMLLPRRQGGGT